MVLYKLKGIKKEEVYEILDGRSEDFNYIVTKRDDKYYIHAYNEPERKCFGQVEPIEVGDTLLCELTFEEKLWLKQKFVAKSVLLLLSIVSSILISIFYVAFENTSAYGYMVLMIIASVISGFTLLLCIYYNARNPYKLSVAKQKIIVAFEDWFNDYL